MALLERAVARVRATLEFVKFSHTVFALPFALIAMAVAAHGFPSLRVFLLILVCMATARTAENDVTPIAHSAPARIQSRAGGLVIR